MKSASKTKEKHIAKPGAGHRHAPLLNRRESRDKLVEELLKTLCALSPIGMYIVQDGKFQYVNPQFERFIGYRDDELVGMESLSFVLPEDRDMVRESAIAMLKGKRTSPYEYRVVNKAGDIRYVIETVTSFQYRRRQATLGNYMDVTERQRAEHDLSERVKELSTLYRIGDIAQRPGITSGELFQEVANLLPTGWQYLEITCARITIDDREFRSKNYSETGWKQSSDITVLGAKVGTVEVGYLEERPAIDEGPFLKEERQLIDAIAEQLGRITEHKQAEEELKSSEERLRILFESAPDAYYLNDLKGNFVDGNKMAEEITGYEKSELIGKNFLKLNLLSAKQILKAAALLAKNARGQPTGPDEFVLKRKDGSRVVAEIRTFPVKIKGEALVLGIARDITERKRAEEQIQHLNLILQAIRNVNQLITREKDRSRLLEGICHNLTETRGYYSAWIALLDESGGYVTSAEAGLSKGFRAMMKRLKRGELPDCAQRALKQSDIMVIEDPLSSCTDCPLSSQLPQKRGAMTARLARDGKVYGLLAVSMPTEFVSDKEEHSLFQELAGDISFALHSMELEDKHKRAEEALRESEEKYSALVEQAKDGVVIVQDGVHKFANQAMERISGYTAEEIPGIPLLDAVAPEYHELALQRYRLRMAGKKVPPVYEIKILCKDGTTKEVEVSPGIIQYDGRPADMAIIRDITERKRAEEALRQSEEKYSALVQQAKDGVVIVQDGVYKFANQAIVQLSGYTAEEIPGMPFLDVVAPEHRELVLQRYKLRMAGEKVPPVYEIKMLRKDGTTREVEVSAGIVQHDGRPADMAIIRDITERRRAEEALCQSEEKLRRMFESVIDAITVTNLDGVIIDCNERTVEMHGVSSKEEVLGKSAFEFIASRDHERAMMNLQKTIEEGSVKGIEYTLIRADGSEFPGELSASVLNDASGNLTGFIAITRDITERKQAEEARCEIDRLKSEFISNISHELRSPLHSIRGFSNLMLEGKVPDPETQKEFLTIIDRQSEHLSSLVDNLLDTSRIEAGQFSIQKQLASIENIIHSAVETFYTLTDEKGIIVTEDIPPALPQIEVDAERLKQVMMNLLSNAIKFTEDAGPVTVKVEAGDGELLVQVADRGIGISEEAMPHLFERFRQAEVTSRIGGAGLGLYICRQIIEAHGGRIWAKSKEGKGSTFYFTLPLGREGGNSYE